MAAQQSVKPDADSVEQVHACRLRVVGYLHGAGAQRVLRRAAVRPEVLPSVNSCANPLLTRCECGELGVRSCAGHRESRCPSCAARYRRRVFRVADHGLHRGRHRRQYLLTFTAPSTRPHGRWVPGVRGKHGDCGCQVEDLARWNARQSECWNRLRTALRREHPSLVYLRAVEVQKRGALHLHVLVLVDVDLDPVHVQSLAMAAGFGCTLDVAPLEPGTSKAARYVAKYVTKACDQRESVPWHRERIDYDTGEVTEQTDATYRTWSSSRTWGITMAEVVAASRRAAERAAARRAECERSPDGPQAGGEDRPPPAAPPPDHHPIGVP